METDFSLEPVEFFLRKDLNPLQKKSFELSSEELKGSLLNLKSGVNVYKFNGYKNGEISSDNRETYFYPGYYLIVDFIPVTIKTWPSKSKKDFAYILLFGNGLYLLDQTQALKAVQNPSK